LTARLAGHRPYLWEGELDEGERREVRANVEREATDEPRRDGLGGPIAPVDRGEEDDGTIFESPIFWTVVGVVLIGGGVVAGLVIHEGLQLEPLGDRVVEL
jgi:hypothetical protein